MTGYGATREEETAALQEAVDLFPEADASSIAQAALEELFVVDEGEDPDQAELEGAFWQLRQRAIAEWACPDR
ncbi:MAG TPA: hypothetical protein VFT76_02060 [Actinomycetota bacterium]|nr:hypothetical protein [Actinomycetota bacterium]